MQSSNLSNNINQETEKALNEDDFIQINKELFDAYYINSKIHPGEHTTSISKEELDSIGGKEFAKMSFWLTINNTFDRNDKILLTIKNFQSKIELQKSFIGNASNDDIKRITLVIYDYICSFKLDDLCSHYSGNFTTEKEKNIQKFLCFLCSSAWVEDLLYDANIFFDWFDGHKSQETFKTIKRILEDQASLSDLINHDKEYDTRAFMLERLSILNVPSIGKMENDFKENAENPKITFNNKAKTLSVYIQELKKISQERLNKINILQLLGSDSNNINDVLFCSADFIQFFAHAKEITIRDIYLTQESMEILLTGIFKFRKIKIISSDYNNTDISRRHMTYSKTQQEQSFSINITNASTYGKQETRISFVDFLRGLSYKDCLQEIVINDRTCKSEHFESFRKELEPSNFIISAHIRSGTTTDIRDIVIGEPEPIQKN